MKENNFLFNYISPSQLQLLAFNTITISGFLFGKQSASATVPSVGYLTHAQLALPRWNERLCTRIHLYARLYFKKALRIQLTLSSLQEGHFPLFLTSFCVALKLPSSSRHMQRVAESYLLLLTADCEICHLAFI